MYPYLTVKGKVRFSLTGLLQNIKGLTNSVVGKLGVLGISSKTIIVGKVEICGVLENYPYQLWMGFKSRFNCKKSEKLESYMSS